MNKINCFGFLLFLAAIAIDLSSQADVTSKIGSTSTFESSDCSLSNKSDVILNSLQVTPDPILLPGVITVNGLVTNNVNITDDFKLHIVMFRHITHYRIKLPCVNNFGSCVYDFCELVNKVSNWRQPCPIMAKTYKLDDLQIQINHTLPYVLTGTYEIFAVLKNSDEKELSCSKLIVNLK